MDIKSADTDAWNIAEGKRNGKPLIIRYRPNLLNAVGDARYAKRLIIKWEYEVSNTSELPSDEQSDQLREFEDTILGALDPERIAILAFVVTSAGVREWQFYVSDISEVGMRINDALSGFPKLPINLQVEDDPEWEEFQLLLRQCK